MNKNITLVYKPTISVIAAQALEGDGVEEMVKWVKSHRPECLPEEYTDWYDLFPHNGTFDDTTGNILSDNELLAELAGRKCYDSFGKKAGKKSNREYIANTQSGDIAHNSILYHCKMTFFIAGVSRRLSHELIRNYVGSDRTEEGNPSQESTRYTHHYGHYIVHPRDIGDVYEVEKFRYDMQHNYDIYCGYVDRQVEKYKEEYKKEPKNMDRKRIYEAASQRLDHACETSWIWTTNPVALMKLFKERTHEAADLEFQRLAKKWRDICLERWPNLFVRMEMEK